MGVDDAFYTLVREIRMDKQRKGGKKRKNGGVGTPRRLFSKCTIL